MLGQDERQLDKRHFKNVKSASIRKISIHKLSIGEKRYFACVPAIPNFCFLFYGLDYKYVCPSIINTYVRLKFFPLTFFTLKFSI